MNAKPIAVSMGDPAGIGPEIVIKAWMQRRELKLPPFFVIGDPMVYGRTKPVFETGAGFDVIPDPSYCAASFNDGLPVVLEELAVDETPGEPNPANAPSIIASIERGVGFALSGQASALVTCPIAKAPLYKAGFKFPGHTEFVADLTKDAPLNGPRGPVMMLAGETLRVALATIHTPLADVPKTLSVERIVDVGQVVHAALKRDFGIASPRIAIAGLNPHAGEDGGLGKEEIETINPAAEKLRVLGVNATNAQPADALFHSEARKGYDAVIAMYHDQGLIPLKTLHFWDAVNLTLGLPIVRTSPDHGTGFDIAGKGIARADSFIAALRMAAEIAARRA